MYRAQVLLIVVLFVSGCSGLEKEQQSTVEEPCWLGRPVTSEGRGSIGIANTYSLKPGESLRIARQRAVEGILPLIGEVPDHLSIEDSASTVDLFGHTIYLSSPFYRKGTIFVYASLDRMVDEKMCSPLQCRSEVCKPKWLCQPMSGDRAGFVGVSKRAAGGVSDQYQKAMDNILEQVELFYGVDVSVEDEWYRLHYRTRRGASLGGVRIRLKKRQDVEGLIELYHDEAKLLPQEICTTGDELYLWAVSPELSGLGGETDEEWSRFVIIGYKEEFAGTGTIGYARVHGSGLLSRQIEAAIENGLAELSRQNSVSVKVDESIIQKSGGRTRLWMRQASESQFRPRIKALHIRGEGVEREVFVWLDRE